MSHKIFNIIQKEKCLVWLPEKTASTHAFSVLKNYGLGACTLDNNQMVKVRNRVEDLYTHTCDFFHGHENYLFISTARNPYSRFVSYFKFIGAEKQNFGFYDFLYESILEKPLNKPTFKERVPDYFLRQEHMFEDYSKIPFIQNSEFYTSGKLKELCEKKINHNKIVYDFRDYYDEMSADLVYYNFSKYFELLGYDKDSWKK
jgi:hypothetical protein